MKKVATWIAIAIILTGIAAIAALFAKGDTEKTDDAQIDQYVSPVNVRIAGYVKEIRFSEHQRVLRGDTLLIIDDREYRIQVMLAQAGVEQAQAGEGTLAKGMSTIDERVGTAQAGEGIANAGIATAEAAVSEAQVAAEHARTEFERYSHLLERGAATQQQYDAKKAEYDVACSRLEKAKAALNTCRAQETQAASNTRATAAGRGEQIERIRQTQAATRAAQARLEQAKLNLSYTVVTAPCDGYTGRRNLEVGQLVSPGMAITTIVPATGKWVTANFKETQMSRIREGQRVEIEIDALPGKTFQGNVLAISSATGSKYSLMPTDNSTGNFVKIQQRIPVKISIDDATEDENRRIAAGMMCEVKVKVK